MDREDEYQIAKLEDRILETVYEFISKIPRPFGLLLSGGFDSGLLAALASPDVVFSVRFPYGIKYDESRYADAIINHLGLRDKTHIITFTKEHFEEFFEPAVLAMGETSSHFSLVPFYMVMQRVKDEGIETVLSGEGLDEYLGGYARQIIFDELNKLHKIPELRNYKSMIIKALGFEHLILQYGKMMGYPEGKVMSYAYLSGYPFQGIIGKMDMELGSIEKMELKMAEAHGVNLFYPYIDGTLAEYCYRLPDNLKIRDGVTKWAFRQICKKYLPAFMMDRGKMGGPVAPVNLWLGDTSCGEFDKTAYLKKQEEILNENIA